MQSHLQLNLFLQLLLLLQQTGGGNDLRNKVGVTVGSRAAVLQVAPPLLLDMAGDAYTGVAVGYAGGEALDAGRLVTTCEAPDVVPTPAGVIHLDVLGVSAP